LKKKQTFYCYLIEEESLEEKLYNATRKKYVNIFQLDLISSDFKKDEKKVSLFEVKATKKR
jgi:hypothetical protein